MPQASKAPEESTTSRLKHDSRMRKVLLGGASALANRGLALIISLISLPLTTRYLGAERYGIWVTVSSSINVLAVLDLGISSSLTNRISHAYAANDESMARTYYATALWISTAVAAIVGILGFLLWPHLHLEGLVRTADPTLGHQASLCYAIAFAFFLIGFPLNLTHKVLSGYQKTQIVNYFLMLSSVFGLVAIVLGIHLHVGLVGLMLMYSGTLVLGNAILNVWVVGFWRRSLAPTLRSIRLGLARELLQSGSGFLLIQIAGLVVFNSDNLVIAHYVGAAEVMPYSITWRLATYATLLQGAVNPSLWPAYTEAYARGNYDWVRRTFWLSLRTTVGIAAIALGSLFALGRPIIRWYIGPHAVPGWTLLAAICLWSLIASVMDVEACLLAAVDRVKIQGILSVVAAVINLAVSIVLAKRVGPIGVVYGTAISYAVALIGPQTVEVYRALYHPPPPKVLERVAPESVMQEPLPL